MNVTKCENGHFFDLETYECCPHCGAGVFTVNSKEKNKLAADSPSVKISGRSMKIEPAKGAVNKPLGGKAEKSKKIWPFSGKKDRMAAVAENEPDAESISFSPAGESVIETQENDGKQENKAAVQVNETILLEADWPPAGEIQPVTPTVMEKPVIAERPVAAEEPASGSPKTAKSPEPSAPAFRPKPMKTIGVFQNISNEPVTGWLVCIEGEMQGEAFNIVSGSNKIGRNMDMDIVIMDASISGENQAILTFDPKSQVFYIKPGEGKALMYFNDEEEFFDDRRKLKAYDRLTIGNAKFVFVPLCGEQFNWKDYLKES